MPKQNANIAPRVRPTASRELLAVPILGQLYPKRYGKRCLAHSGLFRHLRSEISRHCGALNPERLQRSRKDLAGSLYERRKSQPSLYPVCFMMMNSRTPFIAPDHASGAGRMPAQRSTFIPARATPLQELSYGSLCRRAGYMSVSADERNGPSEIGSASHCRESDGHVS